MTEQKTYGPWGTYQHWIASPSGKRHLIGPGGIGALAEDNPIRPFTKCGKEVYTDWGDPEPRRTFVPEGVKPSGVSVVSVNTSPQVPEEAVEALAGELMLFRFGGKLVESRYLIRWEGEIYRADNAPKGLAHHWDQARSNARRAFEEDRFGAIRKQEQERLLDGLREWLGSDHEYEVLAAIHADLKANPQLVPEVDVPLRLLQALRAAVDRFSSLVDSDA